MTASEERSYVSGASAQPLVYWCVDEVLKAAAAQSPQRLGLAAPFQSLSFSFAELDAEVERVARGLVALGLERGDRIGIWSPNCAEWILTMFAAARAGLVLVNINPAYRTSELEFALRLTACRALVFPARFKTSDYAGMLRTLIPELAAADPCRLATAAFPALRWLILLGSHPMEGTLSFAQLKTAGEAL